MIERPWELMRQAGIPFAEDAVFPVWLTEDSLMGHEEGRVVCPTHRHLFRPPRSARPRRRPRHRRLGPRPTQGPIAPRPPRDRRGPLWRPLHHPHQPSPTREVARPHRRPHRRRRRLRRPPPQRPPHRAKGPFQAKGGLRHRQVNSQRRFAPITMPVRSDHDAPISAFTMAGIRTNGSLVQQAAPRAEDPQPRLRRPQGPLACRASSQSRAWPPLAGASAHGRDARRGRPSGSRPEQRDNGEQG